MILTEGCSLLENLELIPVNILDSEQAINNFCQKYVVHKSQILFTNSKISEILSMLNNDSGEFILTDDVFKIKFIFASCDGTPIAYGPYCTELLSTDEIKILLSHLELHDISAESLARQRSRYTVKPQQNVQYYLNILISNITGKPDIHTVKKVSLINSDKETKEDIITKDIHIKLVRDHYAQEKRLMESIANADFTEALDAWHFLHGAVSYNNIGHTMDVSRISAGITRTLLRIGAMEAGLPPEINDYISGKSTQIIHKSRTIDAINLEHERLIKEYCDVISDYKSRKYSSMVMSTKYFIEKEYDKPITLNDIAYELSCSSSHLAHLFKKETGTTPMTYLNQVRMKIAAKALSETHDSVADIAASVGILDPNYFVKCFKRQYSITPTEFRKRFL